MVCSGRSNTWIRCIQPLQRRWTFILQNFAAWTANGSWGFTGAQKNRLFLVDHGRFLEA